MSKRSPSPMDTSPIHRSKTAPSIEMANAYKSSKTPSVKIPSVDMANASKSSKTPSVKMKTPSVKKGSRKSSYKPSVRRTPSATYTQRQDPTPSRSSSKSPKELSKDDLAKFYIKLSVTIKFPTWKQAFIDTHPDKVFPKRSKSDILKQVITEISQEVGSRRIRFDDYDTIAFMQIVIKVFADNGMD